VDGGWGRADRAWTRKFPRGSLLAFPGATQAFTVIVLRPATPTAQAFGLDGSGFHLSVNGDAGPDYVIQASTNLVDWADVFVTNSSALPFTWSDGGAGGFERRFYRIMLGP
jgi:hypothetical protein